MSYEAFKVEIENGVAHVILNRPESMNAMGKAFWPECRQIFESLSGNPEVRVVVVTSTGKHFSAGMDLSFFSGLKLQTAVDPGRKSEQLRRLILDLQESFNAIERCNVPVLIGIHGAAIGGAVDMMCACDTRYCTKDAFSAIQEIKIGMTADLGTLQRLQHLIPSGLARELAYTGRKLRAEEAQASGFVTRVFADHEAMVEGLLKIAREIATRSPLAVVGSKEMLDFARDHSVEDGLNYIATWNAAMILTGDLEEGLRAQAEKRLPEYENLLGIS